MLRSLVLNTLAVCLLSGIEEVYGLRCLECSDMPTPADCGRITTCGHTESCYVDQLITSGGIILYNSGCRSQFRCAGPPGKRFLSSSTDIITCSQCCHTEFCNIEGCGLLAPVPPQRGLYCFECDAQKSPDSCRDIVTCDFGYTCFLEKVVLNPVDVFYKSHCIEEKACTALETFPSIVGRRRQTVDQCPMCCRTDFCNDNCRRNITSSGTPTVSIKHNVFWPHQHGP